MKQLTSFLINRLLHGGRSNLSGQRRVSSVIVAGVPLLVAVLLPTCVQAQTTTTFKPFQIHVEYPAGVAGTFYLTNNNLRIPTNGATGVSGANWVIADELVSLNGAPSGCTATLLASDLATTVSDIPVVLSTSTAALNTNLIIKLVFDGTQTSGNSTLSFAATGAGLPEDDFYLPLDVARIWNGPGNALVNGVGSWSDASKWLGGAPSGNDAVVFSMDTGPQSTGAQTSAQTNNVTVPGGTIQLTNSFVDNDYTIASLRFSLSTNSSTGTTNWENLYIKDGKTLTVNGNSGFSLLKDVTYINNKTYVSIWGTNGTFKQQNENANFSILNDYQSGTTAAGLLDMTGLGNCNLDVSRVAIGDVEAYPYYWNLWQTNQYSENSTTVGGALPMRPYSTWKMALTNIVKAVYVDPYNYTNAANRNYSIELGRTSYGGGSSGNDYIMTMGYSNVFNADSICVGGYACLGGLLQFGNTGSYAKFRGVNGTGRMSVFAFSDAAHTPFGTTAALYNTGDNTKASPGADFTKGTVDMLVDRFYMSLDATNVTANGKGVSQSLMAMNSGTINANTAILGYQSQGTQTNVSYCYALMYVSNSASFTVNGNLTLGYSTAAIGSVNTEGNGYGQLLIGPGGTTVMVSNIMVGGPAKSSGNNKIVLNNNGTGGANLIVSNSIADSTPNGALGTFSMAGSDSLTLFIDGSKPVIPLVYVTNLTASGTGNKLVIGGIKNVGSYPAYFPLIQGAGPAISAGAFDAGVVMPAGSGLHGTLVLSSSNTIDIQIIARTPNNLVWRGADTGGGTAAWDYTTKNWLNLANGQMTNYDNPDNVAFDNTAGYATNITLSGFVASGGNALTPGTMNVTNSTLLYTIQSGGDNQIIGGPALNKYGSGTLDIEGATTASVQLNQGSLTGAGSVGGITIASGAVLNFSGSIGGSVNCSGTGTSAGNISGTLTVLAGGVMTNSGTLDNPFTVAANGLLYNSGSLTNIGVGSVASPQVASGGSLINGGTIGNNLGAQVLYVNGTFTDLGLFGESITLYSVTIGAGGQFYPGGGTTSGSFIANDGTGTFPGALLLIQGSTNYFEIDPGANANTFVSADHLSYGGSTSTRNLNGGTLYITKVGASSYSAGQTFQLFHNQYVSTVAPYDTGTSTNTFPVIVPSTPGPGLTWDLSHLWVPDNSGVSGSIGVISASTGPSLTNSFSYDGSGNIVAQFSWDTSYLGYRLETEVAPNTVGINPGGWTGINGSWTNTTVTITNAIGTNGVYYRLAFP